MNFLCLNTCSKENRVAVGARKVFFFERREDIELSEPLMCHLQISTALSFSSHKFGGFQLTGRSYICQQMNVVQWVSGAPRCCFWFSFASHYVWRRLSLQWLGGYNLLVLRRKKKLTDDLSHSLIHVGLTEIAPENGVSLTHSFFPIFNPVCRFIFNAVNGVVFMGLCFYFVTYSTQTHTHTPLHPP